MYIIKNVIDIKKINNYLLSNNYITEYYIFNISINTGISVTNLLNLKGEDILLNNAIKNNISLEKDYKLSEYSRELFSSAIQLNSGKYLFLNDTNTNLYNRSQFYKKLKEVSRELNIDSSISNKSCEYTFAYHYLLQTSDINYLCKVFNKSKIELINLLFDKTEIDDFNVR